MLNDIVIKNWITVIFVFVCLFIGAGFIGQFNSECLGLLWTRCHQISQDTKSFETPKSFITIWRDEGKETERTRILPIAKIKLYWILKRKKQSCMQRNGKSLQNCYCIFLSVAYLLRGDMQENLGHPWNDTISFICCAY